MNLDKAVEPAKHAKPAQSHPRECCGWINRPMSGSHSEPQTKCFSFGIFRGLRGPITVVSRFVGSLLTSLLVSAAPAIRAAEYTDLGARLEPIVREEMSAWGIGGIAIALVDDQRVVYAAGFGEARRDSLFRVGSISKLFNAVAVMQQVEAGRLDLDTPVPPELLPLNPFADAPPVTLRQLLCHRSGLPRESAVGGYLDVSEPGLAATVASARAAVLATRPGGKMRYSNLGPSLAGFLVERAAGVGFEDYQHEHILGPLGLHSSAWTLARADRARIVVSWMRVADGRGGWRRIATPLFDLGTIPAGNLFSTAEDLARFASGLLAGGGRILRPESLREMWTPQLTDQPRGFGLGFAVGNFRGHRAVSHSGAVYGHSTSLVLLPEKKLAAIVLANEDIANGRVRRITHAALSLLLEMKFADMPPPLPPPHRLDSLAPYTGDFESSSYWARLEVRDGRLVGDLSGQPTRFTARSELEFTADSRIEDATPVTFIRGEAGVITGFKLGDQEYRRLAPHPPPLPAEWQALTGTYGPAIIPVIIHERHGHLYAMTENMVDYRLTPVNRHAWALPAGMYVDEQIVFLPGPDGRIDRIDFANMILRRRDD